MFAFFKNVHFFYALFQVPGSDDQLNPSSSYNYNCNIFHNRKYSILETDIGNYLTLSLKEIRDSGVMDVIGGELWEACFYLCGIILLQPEIFLFQDVLELGSGLGLPSFLLTLLKAVFTNDRNRNLGENKEFDVCCTDNDPTLLENLKVISDSLLLNIDSHQSDLVNVPPEENANKVKLSIRSLDWNRFTIMEGGFPDNSQISYVGGDFNSDKPIQRESCDIIIGSALVYSPDHVTVAHVIRYYTMYFM